MIYQGDCLEVLKTLESDSIDSLVTDPPAGISFMGKSWDDDKGGRDHWIKWLSEVMTECMRVMKPGAHGLVWAIPRTSHWTATALENAGFEVRDVLTHLFGSGFPKSLDVSKAIDKMHGAERNIVGQNPNHRSLKQPIAMVGAPHSGEGTITAPSSDDAKQWQGWGTALKPASEHWILVRKPLEEKTVAKNVLKWGTGAINIDASRIGTEIIAQHQRDFTNAHGNKLGAGTKQPVLGITNYTVGRFPANLVFSCSPHCTDDQHDIECAIRRLDEQSGQLKGGGKTKVHTETKQMFGMKGHVNIDYPDSGGASRFFYCAKISSSERNAAVDNGHPTVKPKKLMSYLIKLITPPNGIVLDPFMGSGSTGLAAKESGFEFIGIEKEAEYFEIAEKRINE